MPTCMLSIAAKCSIYFASGSHSLESLLRIYQFALCHSHGNLCTSHVSCRCRFYLPGRFYYLIQPFKLTYDEAVRACQKDGAQIAKVGQMYAAWKLLGYDRCDAGWLADGSVRYPITQPRQRCSPTEAAVRFSGFPDKKHKLYGVYCFKGHN